MVLFRAQIKDNRITRLTLSDHLQSNWEVFTFDNTVKEFEIIQDYILEMKLALQRWKLEMRNGDWG